MTLGMAEYRSGHYAEADSAMIEKNGIFLSAFSSFPRVFF